MVGPACSAPSGSARLVLVFRRGPAAPGSHFLWRLSHSPQDPPGCLGLWGLRWLGKGGPCPHPRLEPRPPKPSGDLACRILDLCGELGRKSDTSPAGRH